MGKPEASIENYLVKRAKELNFFCTKYTAPSTAGVPDRILIGYGKTVFIETKKAGENLRPLQQAIIKKMILHGAIVYKANSKEDVDYILQEIQNIPDAWPAATNNNALLTYERNCINSISGKEK